jgi:hypothetical protein
MKGNNSNIRKAGDHFKKWDLYQFIDPEHRGNPSAAMKDLYYGSIPRRELEWFCDLSVRMVLDILVRVGTTGNMCCNCRKRTFEIIFEGDRRGLFTSDELDQVMSILCEAPDEDEIEPDAACSETHH